MKKKEKFRSRERAFLLKLAGVYEKSINQLLLNTFQSHKNQLFIYELLALILMDLSFISLLCLFIYIASNICPISLVKTITHLSAYLSKYIFTRKISVYLLCVAKSSIVEDEIKYFHYL